jgi:serine O-acetyltransferase
MSAIGQAAAAPIPVSRLSLFGNISADIRRAALDRNIGAKEEDLKWTEKFSAFSRLTTQVVVAYRFIHWLRRLRVPVVRQLLLVLAAIYESVLRALIGVCIDPRAEIGPGFLVHTPYGVLVGGTRIGANCTVQTGVLIPAGSRGIGDNVYFGAGAKVIADTKIGNNVVIVANSLVLTDVADNTTVVGVPARIRLRGGRPQRFTRIVTPES